MTSQLCSVSVRSRAGATEFESTVMNLPVICMYCYMSFLLYVLLYELPFICIAI